MTNGFGADFTTTGLYGVVSMAKWSDIRRSRHLLEFYELQQIPSGDDMIQFPILWGDTKKWGWSINYSWKV